MSETTKTRRVARNRSAGTATNRDLPQELIIWDILVRLPAKAVMRCRAVCLAWRDTTRTADFLLSHRRHQPSLPLICLLGETSFEHDDDVEAAIDAFDLRHRPTERQPVLRFNNYSMRRTFIVHASCDGLILLSLANGRFYLCNPSTRQWMALPRLNGVRIAGMYSHGPSGEYRILYWRLASASAGVYYVLTVGSGEGPRNIGLPIASPAVNEFVKDGMMYRPPVSLHNRLHWIEPYWEKKETILVFDTVGESFSLMHYPADEDSSYHHLLEMEDGTLGVSLQSRTSVQLRVLQDYGTEASWSLRYQVEFPVASMGSRVLGTFGFHAAVVSEDGDVLCSDGGSALFHLDNKGVLVQTFRWDGLSPGLTGFRFRESLVKHAFLDKPRRGGRRPPLPRFLRGL